MSRIGKTPVKIPKGVTVTAQGQTLSVVSEEVLTFNDAEAIQLFARYGLSEITARTAQRTTRGRAARLDTFARRIAGEAPAPTGHPTFASLFKRTG